MSAALQQTQPDRAELQQAVRRLTRTVDHLLDATRLESGLLQPVREWCDPAEILREAVARTGLKEDAVKVTVARDLPMISVDSRLIDQALITLLSNAAAYGSQKEPIDARVVHDDSAITFSLLDRGPGLAPGEEQQSLRKILSRSDPRLLEGSGLGLSIARQLVEAHGGEIAARNREGGGACFSIRIPLSEQMRLPGEAMGALGQA